ncbi:MAG: Cof-type HAD-IIB family hydrolase [Bacilli bacterium]|jgi:Cof subfamily protein (haloacid dehalogenase superfamily)|nr:Cof-type HAD-IIB family hydrolase [Bacilli bacterium]
MFENIKIAFFDVDGTLYSYHIEGFHESTIEALRKLKENNIKIAIATGRPYEMLYQLEALTNKVDFDYFVVSNGQAIYQNDKLLYKNYINPEDVKNVIKKANELDYAYCLVGDDYCIANKINNIMDFAFKKVETELPEVRKIDESFNKPANHLVMYENLNTMYHFRNVIKHSIMTSWTIEAYDFVPNNGVKANGIKLVIDHLGIDPSEAIAFGDGHNDLDMIKYVGFGVAMGNASDELKEAADYVCEHIDDDGVYKTLKKIKLI